jgi:hypothetical protein
MPEMSEVFWSLVLSSSIAFLLALCRLCYKSKCSSIKMPCLEIVRDTTGEEKTDELEIQFKPNSVKNQDNNESQV